MIIALEGQFPNSAIVRRADYASDYHDRILGSTNAFETSTHTMSEVRFGTFVYPARQILRCYFIRAKEEFVVEGLSPSYVGNGATLEDAQNNFSENLHAGIQTLIYKRPFEMSADEAEKWDKINDAIDITVFKNRTPISVQQYGTVSHGKIDRPCQIKWDNGYTERIDLRQVLSPEFVTYAPGQPIFAVVRRDAVTREIIDIPYVERVAGLRSAKQIEDSGFLQQIGDAADLPETDWD